VADGEMNREEKMGWVLIVLLVLWALLLIAIILVAVLRFDRGM
jgi:hypothetical protein